MEKEKSHLLREPYDDAIVIRFRDRKILDELVIKEIGDELIELIEKHNKTKLLVNFEGVDYLSSAALGKLITLNKKAQAANGKLKLCCINRTIFEVFKITKLDQLFDIYDTQESALATF